MKQYTKNMRQIFASTYAHIKQQGIRVFFPVLAEVLFLFVYAALSAGMFRKIREYAYAIQAVVAQNSGTLSEIFVESGITGALAQSDVLEQLVWRLGGLVLILLITAYIIYCLLQGITWRLALNIAKKGELNAYVKSFFVINLFWLPFFILYYAASTLFYFLDTLQDAAAAGAGSIVAYVGFLLLLYLAAISYTLLDRMNPLKAFKTSFLLGFGHAHYTLIPGAILIVTLFVLTFMFELIAQWDLFAGLAFGILTILPALSIARVLLFETLKKQ